MTLDIEDVAPDAGETTPNADNAKSVPRSGKRGMLGKLGDNKKTRGGPRRLVKGDVERLAGIYMLVGMGLAPVRPNIAQAFVQQAEACADAWATWAEQNDTIRRVILWLIEGGAAGAVLMAHLPIALTMIPEDRVPPMMAALFTPQGENPNGQGEETPDQAAFVEWQANQK